MRMLFVFLSMLAAQTLCSSAESTKRVSGVVLDENETPVSEAEVSWSWSANGVSSGRDWKDIWKREGQMAVHKGGVQTDDVGRFSLDDVNWRRTLLVLDKKRTRGGVGYFDTDKRQPIAVAIHPLVRLRGKLTCDERTKEILGWTGVNVKVENPSNDGQNSETLAICGSFTRQFSFLLPPGRYVLEAYGTFVELDDDVHTRSLRKPITLTVDKPDVDLGTLNLELGRVARAKFAGRWGNLSDYYGKEPPKWNVTDSRGVDKAVSLADFKGKWVLVEFWGFG